MKRLLTFLFVVLMLTGLIFICAGCGQNGDSGREGKAADGAKIITWRLQSAYGESDLEYMAFKPFVEAVKEKTGGRLIINTFPGGTIVPEEEQLEACALGAVDAAHALGGYWRGKIPVGDVDLGLPGQYLGFRTLDKLNDLLYEFEDGGLAAILREAYEKQGNVFYLGSHSFHSYPVIISTVPIATIEDFKGLIIRATGSYADLFNELGASATFVPGGEIYTALQLGTLDAATWSVEGFLGYSWYEVAPYIMTPCISDHNVSHILINLNAWRSLPDDFKEIVLEAYREVYMPKVFELYEAEWEKIIEKQGELHYKIIEIPEETIWEIRKIAREKVWPKIAQKDDYTRRAVELVERWHNLNAP